MLAVFITTSVLLSLQTVLLAQSDDTSDYLVLNAGDTLYGTVEHVDQRGVNPKYYKKIRFTNTDGHQKKYKRKNVAAFRVNNTLYEGFWLHQSSQKIMLLNPRYAIDSEEGERYFLKLVSKGKLSHYQLEWWEQGESTLMWMDLLKKEEAQFLIRATQGQFGLKRKVLGDYFQECPALKEQILHRQFNEVMQIVDFYHSHCID